MNKSHFHPVEDIFEYHTLNLANNIQIRYGTADDGTTVPKGVVLLLHGRAEFIEKYKGIALALLRRGYKVVSPDWRGQGLSSRELENRHKGHVWDFDDYISDLEQVVSQVVAPDAKKVVILSHSMGGHVALRFMNKHPGTIHKAFLSCPMIDIAFPLGFRKLMGVLSDGMADTRFVTSYLPCTGDYIYEKIRYKGNNLSHDPDKFWIIHDEIKKNPSLAIGGPTWSWIYAAFRSNIIIETQGFGSDITTPVFILNGGKDKVVSKKAQIRLQKKLVNGTYQSIKDAFHEIMFEKESITRLFWQYFDRFVED